MRLLGYNTLVLACGVMAISLHLSRPSSALPNFHLNNSPAFFPDQLDEVINNCENDPACNTNLSFGIQEGRCASGDGFGGVLREIVNTRTNVIRTCNPFVGEVLWPQTGQCVILLTQGPCPSGFWVKLQVPSLQPSCERRPCGQNEVFMQEQGGGGECMALRDTSLCPPGQQLFGNEFGTGECDCAPGTVYHALSNYCYKPYSQGPCPHGQIIKVLDGPDNGKAVCQPNLCPFENMVRIDDKCQVQDASSSDLSSGTCYQLETTGPCSSGIFSIDEILLEPVCLLQTETHSIFNLPNIRGCPRGSIRDIRGRCRRDFSNAFRRRPSVVTTRPGTDPNRICPKGQVLLGGVCYRVSRGSSKPSS